jgi:hypothetical protein
MRIAGSFHRTLYSVGNSASQAARATALTRRDEILGTDGTGAVVIWNISTPNNPNS